MWSLALGVLGLLVSSTNVNVNGQLLLPINQQHQQLPLLATPDDFVRASEAHRPRVAIVGAGAGGSFASFWLSQLAKTNSSLAVDVTLFEATDRIGGRAATIELPGHEDQPPIELGASIFVEANKNLWKASKVFNLSLQDGHGGGKIEQGVSIFDGEAFRYESTSGSPYFWRVSKLLWMYGRAPLRIQALTKAAVAKFVALYTPTIQAQGPWRTVPSYAKALGLRLYGQSIVDYLRANSVTGPFVDDFTGAAVRVNYGQTPAHIHAVDGMVSMAAEGATSVIGGNKLIFERFVAESDAHVKLLTPVRKIVRLDDGKWAIPSQGIYDAVIIATPFHLSDLQVVGADTATIPKQDYVRLHVTILVTSSAATKRGFFVPAEAHKSGPHTVLSTFAYAERGLTKRPRLNSVNYLREVEPGKWAIKIFSEREVDDSLLDDLFGLETISWVHRVAWHAYPRATPMHDDDFAGFELAPRLYYANAFEPFVSTMETATVGAANAVNLLIEDVFGHREVRSWATWDDE